MRERRGEETKMRKAIKLKLVPLLKWGGSWRMIPMNYGRIQFSARACQKSPPVPPSRNIDWAENERGFEAVVCMEDPCSWLVLKFVDCACSSPHHVSTWLCARVRIRYLSLRKCARGLSKHAARPCLRLARPRTSSTDIHRATCLTSKRLQQW